MIFRPKAPVPLFDGFSLRLPFGLQSHRDGGPDGSIIFITDHLRRFTVSFEQGTDFFSMARQSHGGWLTWRENGKTLHQRRCMPRPTRRTGNYAFFKMEMPNEKGRPVAITGQLITSFAYRWSADTEPVLRALLRNMTHHTPPAHGSRPF